MAAPPEILRYAAFTADPAGGNPAGVVLDAGGLDVAAMASIAAEVGYSETAFVTSDDGSGGLTVRYFSPESEVPFCGHATIATAVAHADRHGARPLVLATASGEVHVDVAAGGGGGPSRATLTSVEPWVRPAAEEDVAEALAALGWAAADLDPALPARIAYAGARHLVLGVGSRERLAALHYDFDRLRALMEARGWVTVALVHRDAEGVLHARNPFPTGGVVEDPATGAAAAAVGAYLRELGLVTPPATVEVHQGEDMGRPSRLTIEIPEGSASGVRVSGVAVPMGAA